MRYRVFVLTGMRLLLFMSHTVLINFYFNTIDCCCLGCDVASYPGARGQEISAWYLLLAHALKIRLFYCKIFRLRHENVVAVIQATPKLLGL